MTRFIFAFVMLFAYANSVNSQSVLDSLLFRYEEQIGSEKIGTGINISSYYDNDNLFKSLDYANEVLGFALEFGSDQDLLVANNRLGIVYYKLGDLSKSNDYFLKALEIVSNLQTPDLLHESRLMNNIANNYGELKQEALAIEYYQRSLAIKKRLNDSTRFSITLNNMALTYSEMKLYDSAYLILKDAIIIDALLNDDLSLAYSQGSLGEVFLNEGKADSALLYLNQSLNYFKKIPNSDYVLSYYHQKLGEATFLLNTLDDAKKHYSIALELAIKAGAIPIQRDCYRGLQMVSEKLGDYKVAIEYGRLFAALQDSLYKEESAQKLSAIETNYQIKNKEQEISVLNANARLNQFKFYGAVFIAFVVMVLLGFLYYRYLFKAKANYLLEKKNGTIQQQNREIMEGVEYAKGIQEAILPDFRAIDALFESSYLYFKPAQVVSGDFYWVEKINGDIILVLADGTGQGVPGAFLSVIGTSLLKQIISENRICKPDDILVQLNKKVIDGLGQSKLKGTLKYGMDVAVCTYDTKNQRMAFAGAKRSIILKRDGKVELIKGNRYAIGGQEDSNPTFDIHKFDVKKGDSIVLFTDGVIDQFGGTENKKYLTKRLIELLEKSEGVKGIQANFESEINNWRGSNEQTDDMLLLAVEI